MSGEFTTELAALAARVDASLQELLPPEDETPGVIHAAMRYSVFAGGKRVRPALCLLVARAEAMHRGESPDEAEERALIAGAAIEMVHTYSLIHDDLPCMDDDDLRRGRPTCHRVYGEATAVLAGDALNTLAFETAAVGERGDQLVRLLAISSGTRGMVGGQVDDLRASAAEPDAKLLESIHLRKTAMLFAAAAGMGALAGGGTPERVEAWKGFGRTIGLAFQITDDVLDVTADAEAMGKSTGKDAAADKLTYPGVHGLEASRRLAGEHLDAALRALESTGDPELRLVGLVELLRRRNS